MKIRRSTYDFHGTWLENLGKRQVKAPKIYVRDAGLLHALLGLETHDDLWGHVKSGASWEGFAIEQVLSLLRFPEAYFWGTHQGAEVDLFIPLRGKRYGFEMKLGDAPVATKSMRIAIADLGLERLYVVYPGRESYPLHDRIDVIAIRDLPARLRALARR